MIQTNPLVRISCKIDRIQTSLRLVSAAAKAAGLGFSQLSKQMSRLSNRLMPKRTTKSEFKELLTSPNKKP